jgi:hypothetical protein
MLPRSPSGTAWQRRNLSSHGLRPIGNWRLPRREQNVRICAPIVRPGRIDKTAPTGGSRSFARARLVTLGERLPGSFSVRCKIQKRSDDPGTRDDQAE